MTSNEIKQVVLNWIADGCDWDKGMMLYSVYGKNRALAKNIAGKKATQSDKLIYELCKSVGLLEIYKKLKEENKLPVGELVKTLPSTAKEKPSSTGSVGGAVSMAVCINQMKIVTVPERRPEFIEGPETIDVKNIEQYPATIRRVIAEYSEMYQERSKMHRIMCEMPEGNSQTLKTKRAEIFDIVKALTIRLELLYDTQEIYKSTGFVPAEDEIWPKPKEKPTTELTDDPEHLRKMKKNQQSANTKDQNLLDYQSEKKGASPKPMPTGPKRMLLENRIKARLKFIQEIEYKLVKVNQ